MGLHSWVESRMNWGSVRSSGMWGRGSPGERNSVMVERRWKGRKRKGHDPAGKSRICKRIHLTNVPCQVADGGQGQLILYLRQCLYVIDPVTNQSTDRRDRGLWGNRLSTFLTPTRSRFRVIVRSYTSCHKLIRFKNVQFNTTL